MEDSNPIATLQTTINRLWEKANLGPTITVATKRSNDGSPHVEPTTKGYDIVITERGSERDHKPNLTLLETARWYVHDMAEAHAQKSELATRTPPEPPMLTDYRLKDDGYSRWNWMAPTVQTMQAIDPEFGQWTMTYYADVFTRHPLADHELRNARYPLPSTD